jgi:hypothetical protein
MRSAKMFLTLSVCLFSYLPPVFAQQPQSAATISKEATIIIEPRWVRITAQKAGQEMRLQVFDHAGELVYDSGATLEPEIQWLLQNGAGEELKNGLYAYTLTIREAETESSRVRRGHLIVDRVKGRDGADKLWVTSQSDGAVGAELTVARDETAVVVGASGGGERSLERRPGISRRKDGDSEPETSVPSDAEKKALANAALGTAGRIAKFISASEVGDSAITEGNGLVGIGTATPDGALHVYSPNPSHVTVQTAGGTNAWAQFRMRTTNQTWAVGSSQNFNGDQFYLFDATRNQIRMGVQPNGGAITFPIGNVGIGAGAPQNLLHVGPGVSSILASRVNAVIASNQPDAGIAIAQNSGVNVLLQASGAGAFIGSTTNHPVVFRTNDLDRMVVTANGNVGIGADPATKLHVEDVGIAELGIHSRSNRAVLALGNTLSANRYVWTLESGIRGIPGMFGVYNRVVNKSGLEIDGSLNVYVKALQITGGADLSEKFDVAPETGESDIQPGMVVSIDPSNPGKLKLSRQAYDRRVVGVVSGAGGVQPGMTLGQEGTAANGKYPVALSGRVYVRVDASHGAIRPGDLLTASPTPGHAMRARNAARAQGAIIGKAMTELNSGKGLVLVVIRW